MPRERWGSMNLHRNLLHLVHDIPVLVIGQSNHQSSKKNRQNRRDQVERHKERTTPGSFDQSESDKEAPRAQYWFRVQKQTESGRADMSTQGQLHQQKNPDCSLVGNPWSRKTDEWTERQWSRTSYRKRQWLTTRTGAIAAWHKLQPIEQGTSRWVFFGSQQGVGEHLTF